MADEINLSAFDVFNDDVLKTSWFSLKLSITGDAGVGKTTFALEQAAHIAKLYKDEGIPIYIVDTEGAIMANLRDPYIRKKFAAAGVKTLKVINPTKIIHESATPLEGMIKTLNEINALRIEVGQMESPAIVMVDSLTDLRNLTAYAFTQARHDKDAKDVTKKDVTKTSDMGNIVDVLKDTNTNVLDWNKVNNVIKDITSLAKNTNVHAIFTSKEKLEKVSENKSVPVIDGYKGVKFDCDVHIRMFKADDYVGGKIVTARKCEIQKMRGLGRDASGISIDGDNVIISGNFDDYASHVEGMLEKQYDDGADEKITA